MKTASQHPEKILNARIQLLYNFPFFASIMLPLKFINDPAQPTAWTDGSKLGYNEEWLTKYTVREISTVLVHETAHCMFFHMGREGTRDHKKWNDACDHAINLMLLDVRAKSNNGQEIRFHFPHDFQYLADPQYRSMSAEKIYDLLPDDPNGDGRSGEEPSLINFGDMRGPTNEDGEPLSEGATKQLEGAWTNRVKIAAQGAKAGSLPGSLTELIKDITKPQVPWQAVLRQYMTEPAKGDYTWKRPNRRFINQDIYLPSNYTTSLGEIVVAIDSSFSITPKQLSQFAGELNGILEDAKPSKIYQKFVDTKVSGTVTEYTPEDYPITVLEPVGRGGTAFAPAFDWVKEKGISPVCLIYLTDLEGEADCPKPNYPVLWVCTSTLGQDSVNFGRVIKLEA